MYSLFFFLFFLFQFFKSGHAPYDYIIETKEKGRRNWHKADPTNAKEEA